MSGIAEARGVKFCTHGVGQVLAMEW